MVGMNTDQNYNQQYFSSHQNHEAMKNSVVNREFDILKKQMFWSAAGAAVGAALGGIAGALSADEFLSGTEQVTHVNNELGVTFTEVQEIPKYVSYSMGGIAGAVPGGMAGLIAGGIGGHLATYKEQAKLNIDKEYLNTHMSGNTNWEAYREQVAEQVPSTLVMPTAIQANMANQLHR